MKKKNIINDKIEEYYETFHNNSTQLINNKDEAFEIVVLEALYKDDLKTNSEYEIDFSKKLQSDDANNLSKFIVSSAVRGDGGIDIVYTYDDEEETKFQFVQVKNRKLNKDELRDAFSKMKDTTKQYLKDPEKIKSENLKKILQNFKYSQGSSEDKYIVVHRGSLTTFDSKTNNEEIITENEISQKLSITNNNPCVRHHKFTFNKNQISDYTDKTTGAHAYVVNINGLDLAKLGKEYNDSSLGRSLLFGNNFREFLEKKSQTYEVMKKTIFANPEKFWFYNNGITILAKNVKRTDNDENIVLTLENFSIINGAQTTSALAKVYSEHKSELNIDTEEEIRSKLNQIYVLTKILVITDDAFKDDIAIYNNTQNPIEARDLVSRTEEQKQLQAKLYNRNGSEHIFVEIRRGESIVKGLNFRKHQKKITNTYLAQIAFAGNGEPENSKNIRNTLFNKNPNCESINENYNNIFNQSSGILFQKSFDEINELIFIEYILRKAKNSFIQNKKKFISQQKEILNTTTNEAEKTKIERDLDTAALYISIANKSLFLFIYYYYAVSYSRKPLDFNKIYGTGTQKGYLAQIEKETTSYIILPCIKLLIPLIKKANKDNDVSAWIRNTKNYEILKGSVSELVAGEGVDPSEFMNNYRFK
ncbi:MAG: AIPR family protein [Succinivibrionaceae bacterium]|nr:AIPR family protein [Succinivibrionaceae bacterium]